MYDSNEESSSDSNPDLQSSSIRAEFCTRNERIKIKILTLFLTDYRSK